MGACPGDEKSSGVNYSRRSPKGNCHMRRILNASRELSRFICRSERTDVEARDADGKTAEDWAREQKRDKWASELHVLAEIRRR